MCLLITSLSVSSALASTDINNKISKELLNELEKLGDTDNIKVYVTMSDVDSGSVMKTFSERHPEEYETYLKAKTSLIDSSIIPVCEGDVDLKDGFEGKNLFVIDIDDDILQKAIENKRAIYKEYYDAKNTSLLNRYCTKDEQVFISSYSPLAILNVNKNTIMSIAETSDVLSISKFVEEEAINADLGLANQITRADYVRDYYGNTGSGVKIGMVEALGIPDTNDSYLTSATIYIRSGDTNTGLHSTRVARILVGTDSSDTNDGLAPDATLYCCIGNIDTTFYSGIEWLIGQGVNVINASMGWTGYGTYDERAAWIDHIACQHDVHYVNAAGNNAGYIYSPGMAYNAITVGGINDTGVAAVQSFELYSNTSYEECSSNYDRPEKPNLVASAVDFWGSLGTSYSAPQVTGTIAQLCSYSSTLKTKQTAMGAILAASSAEKVQATGDGFVGDTFDSSVRINEQISEREGAGILDSQWARGIIYYGHYWSYTIYEASFPYNKYVTINASTNSMTRVAIFWLKRNSLSGETITQVPFTDLDLYVYDPNNNLVGSSLTSKSNFEIVQFEPTVTGTYRIEIRAYGCDDKEHVGIAVW